MAESDSDRAGLAAGDSQPASADLPTVEQAYRNLLEDNVDPVVITDFDGVVIDANPSAVRFARLAKRAELIGETLNSERVSPALRSLNASLPAARQTDSLHQTIEVRLDGRDFTLDLRTRHVARDGGEAIRWLIHDRTEQQELERARDEQIYMIVHDLRNPLGNIISSLELLKDSLNDPDMTPAPGALLNIALRSSRRISLLVESLMDMTRMEAGQFRLTTVTARLETLIEHAVDFVKPTADRKHIPLTVHLEPGLPPVLIDVHMIERVIVNLLDNACKFVLPGQAVAVGARRGQTNEVEIFVRDEGPGIPPEDRARLFQKFSRGSGISGHTPGTGLGLAFCKLAVVTHGGRISVDSEVGKGSTFTFTLPVETP